MITAIFIAALGTFAASGALYMGQRVVEDRNVVPAFEPQQVPADAGFEPGAKGTADGAAPAPESDGTVPVETFPPAEPEARNILITGADNNDCVDPDSPYAGAFGDRSALGERSDTIMVWRVNPATNQVAVLSFPRDLWVTIAGRQSQQRINVAYERDNPELLRDTIFANFFVPVDYWIQVDFCAFKTLVDAVGGVAVPFDTPVRDVNTGLNVPQAGCYTFDGDHALAYVRSRKLQTMNEDGSWTTDGTSDLGRISRQQDFIRRVADELLSNGPWDPDVARGLIETSSEYVAFNEDLTLSKQLELAGVLNGIDPEAITSYQIEARNATIQGNAVLIPQIEGDNMRAILEVFRGQATLASAPEQELAAENTIVAPPTTADTSVAPNNSTDAGVAEPPVVEVDEIQRGVFPDASVTCT